MRHGGAGMKAVTSGGKIRKAGLASVPDDGGHPLSGGQKWGWRGRKTVNFVREGQNSPGWSMSEPNGLLNQGFSVPPPLTGSEQPHLKVVKQHLVEERLVAILKGLEEAPPALRHESMGRCMSGRRMGRCMGRSWRRPHLHTAHGRMGERTWACMHGRMDTWTAVHGCMEGSIWTPLCPPSACTAGRDVLPTPPPERRNLHHCPLNVPSHPLINAFLRAISSLRALPHPLSPERTSGPSPT